MGREPDYVVDPERIVGPKLVEVRFRLRWAVEPRTLSWTGSTKARPDRE